MRPQQPVRDRNLSIWQSAVRETVQKRALDTKIKAIIEHAASLQAQATFNKVPVGDLIAKVFKGNPQAQKDAIATAEQSDLAFKMAGANQADETEKHVSLFNKLKDLVAKYSTFDLVGWSQCLLLYAKYYIHAHSSPQYVNWQDSVPQDIAFGTIEFRLPATSKVLLIGDWGTHMSDNVALLRQALKKFKPDVILHLGDVYYSGTQAECEANVLDVMDAVITDLAIERPPFFTIPGNHDYYSGGVGFYDMIARVNSSVPHCLQKASYFCLRTGDDHWQFLAMDTGINDRNPVDHMAPSLEKSEVQWHLDKLNNFKGTTVLLSHHQLFSANSKIADGPRPYINEGLNTVFQPYFDKIAAWFWGHEHNLVIYKDDQQFPGNTKALHKGRLVGCSAYEETEGEDPYKINFAQVAYADNMPRLNISQYKSPTQTFYNHAFTILEIAPDKMVAKYFEYPSWDQDFAPPETPVGDPIYTETIPLIQKP